MKTSDKFIYDFTDDYLNKLKRNYLTSEFGYSSWNPPNTTLTVSEHTLPLLMSLSPPTILFYISCLSMLKRNHDPVYACLICLDYKSLKVDYSKRTFYRYIQELCDKRLLIYVSKDFYIVNIEYTHKLYKPKFDIDI